MKTITKDTLTIRTENFCEDMIGDDSHIMYLLNKKIPKGAREDYEMEFTFGEREAEVRKTKTVADVLRYKILDYIENQRDELITSMIDNMDEKEYNDIRAKADGKQE